MLFVIAIIVAIAGGFYFYLQQVESSSFSRIPQFQKAAAPVPLAPPSSKKEQAPPTRAARSLRNRQPKPKELEQKDLFAEFLEKESNGNPVESSKELQESLHFSRQPILLGRTVSSRLIPWLGTRSSLLLCPLR